TELLSTSGAERGGVRRTRRCLQPSMASVSKSVSKAASSGRLQATRRMRETRGRDCGDFRMTAQDVSSQRARFPSRWSLGVLIGGPAAFGWLTLVAHAYATCNVGINASANAGSFLIG